MGDKVGTTRMNILPVGTAAAVAQAKENVSSADSSEKIELKNKELIERVLKLLTKDITYIAIPDKSWSNELIFIPFSLIEKCTKEEIIEYICEDLLPENIDNEYKISFENINKLRSGIDSDSENKNTLVIRHKNPLSESLHKV